MCITESIEPDERDSEKLNRLYHLKQQQLRRAGGGHRADSLLCQVLAAEADAISTALERQHPESG